MRVWGPIVSGFLAAVFFLLAGVALFLVGAAGAGVAVAGFFMLVVCVGIRKTFGGLVDEVRLDRGGLNIRTGSRRERVPFASIASVQFEKRNTSGVMIGTLPVIQVGAVRDGAGEWSFAFVPRTRTKAVRASATDAGHEALVEEIRRRAGAARSH